MAAAGKILVLITGATSGIGFELAAQLMERGSSYHVLVGARSPNKGNASVEDLRSRDLPGSAEMLEIDVTKDETIERAVAAVERGHGRLDVLVNNAGVSAMTPPLRQQMRDAFDTNAIGPAVVTRAFAPLLHKSAASPARVVNISSIAGSITDRLDPSSIVYNYQQVQYQASKAALNMVTACQVYDFSSADVKIFAYDTGFTQSNLGPENKADFGAKPVSEAVRPLIDVLEGKRDQEAGKLLHEAGVYSW